MVFNATFNNISVISWHRGDQFYWWGKLEYPHKNLLRVAEKLLSHNVVLSTPRHEWGWNSQL
jgi:hypothetical protein